MFQIIEMASNTNTYKRRAGSSASHGYKFESDLLCLTYIRCIKLYIMKKLKSFKIANNIDHVGAFDDIVCRIEYETKGFLKTKLVFIQTKHNENAKKHPFSDEILIPRKKRNIEKLSPIHKYIKSYFQIQKILAGIKNCEKSQDTEEYGFENEKIRERLRKTFDCKLEDLHFVYYTNAAKGEMKYFEKNQNQEIVTNILDSSVKGEKYKINLDNMDLSNLCPEIYENLNHTEIDSVKQFMNSFNVYIDQGNEQCLESIIIHEIESSLKNRTIDANILYKTLCEELKHVIQRDEVPFITEHVNYVEKIISLLHLYSQTAIEKEKLNQWRKLYSPETIMELRNDILHRKVINIHYGKLDKSKIVLKCLQLAEMLKERYNRVLLLYVSSETFEMWIAVRNLYNYTKHFIVLVCIDNIPMENITKVCSTEVGTKELIVVISEHNLATQTSFWKELSPPGYQQIMNHTVNFQGVSSTLREIFGDNDLQKILDNTVYCKVLDTFISRVINHVEIYIGSSLPVEEAIYVERRFKINSTILKFEAINEDRDTFLIYPKINVLKSLNIEELKNVSVFENEAEARYNFYTCLESNQSTHLCFANKFLMVLASKGTEENILKYKIDQNVMDEEQLIESSMNNKCTVISDVVGMGKSTALKRLSHCIKTRCKDIWVEYIKLNMQDKLLKSIKLTTNPIDAIMQFLNLDDFGKIIFEYKCNTDGKAALFFDGFDEISNESRTCFNLLLQNLSKTKIQTIFVSTRPNFATELKNNLQSFHFNIVGFNFDDMNSYFLKYWSQNIDNKCTKNFIEIVEGMVSQTKEMKDILQDIIAVPLQTKMIAKSYYEHIIKIINMEEGLTSFELQKLSLYSLYNNLLNMHIDRCMQEKFGFTNGNIMYELTKNLLFKNNSGVWEALACQELFPSNKICNVIESDIDELVKERMGIFVKDHERVKFVHRTYAEFLAAKYVSRLLYESKNTEHLNFIYQTIFIDKNFVILRKFMNAVYEIEKHWESADVDFVLELVVYNKVLLIAKQERNEFLIEAIKRHTSMNEDIRKKYRKNNEYSENHNNFHAVSCKLGAFNH